LRTRVVSRLGGRAMAARGLGLSFIIVVCLRFSSPGAALWYSGALHQPWDNSMKAKVKWLDGVSFVAESGSGHAVVMDGAPEHGGRNIGPRPMEMLLMGLAGCAAFDVVTILAKARQAVTDCEVQVNAERADAVPAVFTRIELHFVVRGRKLGPRQVERAIALSAEKYCSASILFGAAGVEIHHSHEVVEES